MLTKIKSETIEPNLATGNIYLGESTVQLMVWGVVYDFLSFCTNIYGTNYEETEMTVRDSRVQLTSQIAALDHSDFQFGDLQLVLLSIAGCANGILGNSFIPIMIFNEDDDESEEDDDNDDN